MNEYYISIDIEADGPCPGLNSMLQFGAVFYDYTGKELDSCCYNLQLLDGAIPDVDTMKWWEEQERKNPGVYTRTRSNLQSCSTAMKEFEYKVNYWSATLQAKAVVVGFPVTFDFSFLYYYLCKFNKTSCVGFSALDLKTMGVVLNKSSFGDAVKKKFPKNWFNKKMRHTHNALDDARGQGYMFFKMREELYKCNQLQ